MYNWELLSNDHITGIELWKTPTKYLVCQRYLSHFRFLDTKEQAISFCRQAAQEGKF